MKEQVRYTGSFATIGASYLGYTQWSLLSDRPAGMKAAVINTGPHYFSKFIWGTGALNSDVIVWADLLSRMNSSLPLPLRLLLARPSVRPVLDSLPLLSGVDRHFGGTAPPWLWHTITHPDLSDHYWEPLQQTAGPERADIPIRLTTGWYDLLLPEIMEQYALLVHRGCNVALTIGPWTHIGAGGLETLEGTLAWLDQHLAKKIDPIRSSPVRIFVTGAQEWRGFPTWPPAIRPYQLMLSPSRKLPAHPPALDAPDSGSNLIRPTRHQIRVHLGYSALT